MYSYRRKRLRRLLSETPVDIFSVADSNDIDDNPVIKDIVDNAVITGPYSVSIFSVAEFFAAGRPRVVGKAVDSAGDLPLKFPRQAG